MFYQKTLCFSNEISVTLRIHEHARKHVILVTTKIFASFGAITVPGAGGAVSAKADLIKVANNATESSMDNKFIFLKDRNLAIQLNILFPPTTYLNSVNPCQ